MRSQLHRSHLTLHWRRRAYHRNLHLFWPTFTTDHYQGHTFTLDTPTTLQWRTPRPPSHHHSAINDYTLIIALFGFGFHLYIEATPRPF